MFDRKNGILVRTDYQVPDPSGTLGQSAFISSGVIPSARLVMSSQPTANDTIGIGGKTFIFVSSLGAPTSNVQVKIGSDAAHTLASLVKAINGTVSGTEWVEATTAFAVAVLADAVGTSLRIRQATARGGSVVAGTSPSVALAESITAAADIWNTSDLNKSGSSPAKKARTMASFTVEAQMITNGGYILELPFTPTVFDVQVVSSSGVLRSINEAIAITGNGLSFTMAGGATPNIQAGDIITVDVLE